MRRPSLAPLHLLGDAPFFLLETFSFVDRNTTLLGESMMGRLTADSLPHFLHGRRRTFFDTVLYPIQDFHEPSGSPERAPAWRTKKPNKPLPIHSGYSERQFPSDAPTGLEDEPLEHHFGTFRSGHVGTNFPFHSKSGPVELPALHDKPRILQLIAPIFQLGYSRTLWCLPDLDFYTQQKKLLKIKKNRKLKIHESLCMILRILMDVSSD